MIIIYANGALSETANCGAAIHVIQPGARAGTTTETQWASIGHGTIERAQLAAMFMAIRYASTVDQDQILIRSDSDVLVGSIEAGTDIPFFKEPSPTGANHVTGHLLWTRIKRLLLDTQQDDKTVRFEWASQGMADPRFIDALNAAQTASKQPVGTNNTVSATHTPEPDPAEQDSILVSHAQPNEQREPLNRFHTHDWVTLEQEIITHARGDGPTGALNLTSDQRDMAEIGARRALTMLMPYLGRSQSQHGPTQ